MSDCFYVLCTVHTDIQYVQYVHTYVCTYVYASCFEFKVNVRISTLTVYT